MEYSPKEIMINTNKKLLISKEFECYFSSNHESESIDYISFSRLWNPENTEWIDFYMYFINSENNDLILNDNYVQIIDKSHYNELEYSITQSYGKIYQETLRLIKRSDNIE